MILDLKSLIERCNPATRAAMEGAAALCVSRTNYEVELEHFLLKAIEVEGGDLSLILDRVEIRRERIAAQLRESLHRLKTGNTRGPVFSPSLVKLLTQAWTLGTLNYGANEIRTGFALLAALSEDSLALRLNDISRELAGISSDVLRRDLASWTAGSKEESEAAHAEGSAPAEESNGVSAPKPKSVFLAQYTTDMTEEARAGRIDAVVGRDPEIRQVIDVLMRRRQNNPMLTGEAGVGKTAVVEGLALRIVSGDVPPPLRHVRLHSLDLALLQAGASVKGEFENRLKGLVQEIKSSPQPVILFLDEAHTLVGAGAQAGQGDAANILKPALARGELRTIAATTWSEYKQYFERDAALARRFQVVKVEEPSEEQCESMLRGVLSALESHHGVRVLDEALAAAVKLSHRYMPGRQLPDKAVSVLDTACARVALSQSSTPPAMEAVSRRILSIERQSETLERERRSGGSHTERLADLEVELLQAKGEQAELQQRWETEKKSVEEMRGLREQLENDASVDNAARETKLERLKELREELARVQAYQPLTHPAVDGQIIGEVISEWTGVPLGRMLEDEVEKILTLEERLQRRVIGQEEALTAIAQRVQTSRAGLDDPSKPLGVFLLVGPSGVGKTETALALAELLYGGERNLVTINMSEFQEAHSVSTLKGAPPGYVGYGAGGRLTEAVRRQPYSVLLLDEIEKAHPDVLKLFYQVFDKGTMEDGEGRRIDFRNTLILMTSNAASELLTRMVLQAEETPTSTEIVAVLRPELNRIFEPAFLGRALIVPYFPVQDEVLETITRLKIQRIQHRLQQNHGVALEYDDSLVTLIRQRCLEVESGARSVDQLLANTLLPEISRQLLQRMALEEALGSVRVSATEEGDLLYEWEDASIAKAELVEAEA